MTQDFFRKIVKDLNDENTTIAEDGLSSSQFSGCIDTGSYILNAALSGSLCQLGLIFHQLVGRFSQDYGF